MKVIAKTGKESIAVVYIAAMENKKLIEFVESVQPPLPREEKWVLIVSTLYGCPVGCRFCDAGSYYSGKLSAEDIISQIDYMIINRFPNRRVPVQKFKIQFARMGEPAFNQNVLDVLEELPKIYDAPGLLPALSTVAPAGTDGFFDKLLEIKEKTYRRRFQLQFSIHTTDMGKRDWVIPIKKWNFKRIAEYGNVFYEKGGRKITLNFALGKGMPIDPDILLHYFNPKKFLIKITPINPTYQATVNKMSSTILSDKKNYDVIDRLREVGYNVILSIGELEENYIGSNCGQHITNYLRERESIKGGYTYPLQEIARSQSPSGDFGII